MKTWLGLAGAVLVWLAPHDARANGACTAARFHDWNDMGCNQNNAGAGGPAMPQPCPPGVCPPPGTHGMPRWWVSEPYINLCLKDTPLSYTMSSGQEMAFSFYYHQRSKLPDSDEVPDLPPAKISPSMANAFGPSCGTNASWGNTWTMSITVWDPTWESDWRSYVNSRGISGIIPPPSGSYPVYSRGYQALVMRPEGGLNYYNVQAGGQNTIDPQSQVRLTSVVGGQNYPVVEAWFASNPNITPQMINAPTADANGIYWGDAGVGLKLVYPDGSQDVFGLTGGAIDDAFIPYAVTAAGTSAARLLLTQRIDPQGRVTQLGYDYITSTSPYGVYYFRLHYVVDADGRTNTFLYSSGFQLTEIDDPYGRKTRLTYTTLYGNMAVPSSIVDAAGLTNSFSYQGQQTNGWITSLTTPYGQTRFNYYSVPDASVTDGYQQRAIAVSEPTGAQQLYLYQHQNPGFVPATETAPTVPGQTNFDNGSTGSSGHQALTYRNTFHWGRRQYAALSGNYYFNEGMSQSLAYQFSSPGFSQSEFANGLAALGAADYNKAEEKHWLMLGSDGVSITESVSSERDPSPDSAGSTTGLRTWYNYAGKPSPELLGSNPQVSCIARLLPDSTSQYTTYNYYATTGIPGFPVGAGLVSDNEASYSRPDGSIGVLTNWFLYAANSIDLASISNSAGQYVNLGYYNHQIVALTNALNQVTTLSWNPNLTGIQWPGGQSVSLGYINTGYWDTNNNFVPDPNNGFLQTVSWSPSGRSFTINSNYAGLPASVTDDRGVTVANSWDGLNRLTGTVFPDNTTISNIYNRLDLVATKDRLNNWTYYSFDGLQHLTTVTNANNAITTYSWCGCGSLTAILDALTNLTTLNYDNQGNLTNILYPDTSSVTYQFDLAGRMTNAFDGAGRAVRLGYNNQGLVTNVAGANGTWRSATYDAVNRPIRVTDANGVTMTNTFDALGELLTRTRSSGVLAATEGFGYSAAGLVAYTNADHQVTRYGLDGAGRVLVETNANLEVTQFTWDSLDNVLSLADGLNHTRTWQYNEYGWLTNKVDALNRPAFRYAYNANGWITNRWTPEKGNTGYAYDNVGNLKSIAYPQQSITYAYDVLNRLTNMVDAVGTHGFSWTANGQLQSESDAWTTIGYSYSQGLRTQLTIAQPGTNWTQSYNYDSSWRMNGITSPAGSFGYSHNFQPASSLVTGIQLPNGANIVNSYDSLARLTGTALNNYWGHTLDGYTYAPDALGLRTNIVRNLGLTTSTVSVNYDAINQLTGWTAKEANGTARLNEQFGYGYDAAHNLHLRNNGSLAQTFNVDAANELTNVSRTGTFTLSGATPAPATSVTVNGQAAQTYGDFTFAGTNITLVNGANIFTIVATNIYGVRATNILTLNLPQSAAVGYDSNGNLTNDGVKVMGYDSENQLTNATVANSFKKDFIFDGLNRLRIKREYGWISGAWVKTNEVRYVWDGNNIVQLRDSYNVPTLTLTRGLDVSGSLQGAGGIGGILALTESSGASSYFHNDAGGNVTALMDAQENIVARRMFDAFGRTINLTGGKTGVNPFWFSSQLHDENTDIYSYLHRPYTPNPPRWLTVDPSGERSGINLYEFNLNSPPNYVDPDGKHPVLIAAAFGAAIGVFAQLSVDYQKTLQFSDADRSREGANNNDAMNKLQDVINSGGEKTFQDEGLVVGGTMGASLPCNSKGQKLRNLFESLRNVEGYPSAANEWATRQANNASGSQMPSQNGTQTPDQRVELAKAWLARDQAYGNWLKRLY